MSNEIEIKEKKEIKTVDMYNDLPSFQNAWRIAGTLAKSNLVPVEFQNRPENCMIALDLSSRLSMSPFMIMQNIYVVHGKPAFSAKFAISLINASGRFEGNLRFKLEGAGETLSCYAYATYKGEKEPIKGTLVTMKMARQEEWLSRKGSKWQTMPEKMIKYRAASFFANEYCPDLLLGVSVQEEEEDQQPRHVEATVEEMVDSEVADKQASEELDSEFDSESEKENEDDLQDPVENSEEVPY